MALGEQVGLEPLDLADHPVQEPADLGGLAAERLRLLADAFSDGVPDALRQGRLELDRDLGERLDLVAGPLQRGLDVRLGRARLARARDPFHGPSHCVVGHPTGG